MARGDEHDLCVVWLRATHDHTHTHALPSFVRSFVIAALQHKRALLAEKRGNRERATKQSAEYARLKAQRVKERRASDKARRSSRKSSKKEAAAVPA